MPLPKEHKNNTSMKPKNSSPSKSAEFNDQKNKYRIQCFVDFLKEEFGIVVTCDQITSFKQSCKSKCKIIDYYHLLNLQDGLPYGASSIIPEDNYDRLCNLCQANGNETKLHKYYDCLYELRDSTDKWENGTYVKDQNFSFDIGIEYEFICVECLPKHQKIILNKFIEFIEKTK